MSHLPSEAVQETLNMLSSSPELIASLALSAGLPTVEDLAAESAAREAMEANQESRLVALENDRAVINSQTFTGEPKVPTAGSNDNSKIIANTEFVKAAFDAVYAAIVDSSPETLNTLKEIATAFGNDPNFSTTIMNLLGQKLVKDANLSDLSNAATARTNLGLALLASTGSYANLSGVPDASTTTKGVTWFSADGSLTAGRAVQATDTRLSNPRTPIAHDQAISTITGLQDALNLKTADSTLAMVAKSGSYNDLSNKPSTPKITYSTRVQTDASGNYTWTYPVAFAVGVIPHITVSPEASGDTGYTYNAEVTNTPSRTAVTVRSSRITRSALNLVGLLTITLTGASASTWIVITAREP